MVESQGKIDCVTGFSLKKLLLIAVVLWVSSGGNGLD